MDDVKSIMILAQAVYSELTCNSVCTIAAAREPAEGTSNESWMVARVRFTFRFAANMNRVMWSRMLALSVFVL
jgi:hypothetical protein